MVSQMVLVNGFNRYEAAELTGVPYERFTYLDKIGKVKPAGKFGRLVLYSFEQMVEVMVTETYKNQFNDGDMDWILDVLEGQMKESHLDKEMIYFLVKSKDVDKSEFYVDSLDDSLSFKDLSKKLISKITFEPDEDPDDFFIEMRVLKSARYFIKKMVQNAHKSTRLTPDEFLARASLKNFTY